MGLKDKFFKARSKLSIKTYKRPQLFVILMMIIINIIILIIAAFIALAIDDGYSNFFDAFANGSVKWMLTPNAILVIENPNTLLLAVFVLVIGMILFTGTIIALTTNAIKDYFQKKKSGSGRLILDKQIVVLNWNNKVPELVADLIHLEAEDISLVILADIDKFEAEKLIQNAIKQLSDKRDFKNLDILVKQGSPLIKTDLFDISIDKAQSVLIMNSDTQSSDVSLSKGDLNVIKIILSLGEIEFVNSPPIVAEIKNIESKEKVLGLKKIVKSLHEHIIIPVCFDRKLGHVIAQTIINPLIKEVYLSLFSFQDSEVYYLKNLTFAECLNKYSHIIPLAREEEGLFVLAEEEKDLMYQEGKVVEIINLQPEQLSFKTDMKVYIIGTNNKLTFIKDSFDEYESIFASNFEAKYIDELKLKDFVKDFNQDDTPSTILLLSNEFAKPESLDANVIDNLIYLQSHITGDRNIIVEVLEPGNDHIVKDFNINNTIISNKIISLLLSKIALYKETAPFYENLLTIKSDVTNEDDQNIFILPASKMFKDSFPLKFSSFKQFILSFYQCFSKKYMIFGYFRNRELKIISGDLHQQRDVEIFEDDLLVFMKI